MSVAGKARTRRFEIKRKRNRRAKIAALKRRYQTAINEGDRKKILEKIWKMSPSYPLGEITAK
ncbi:MAG: DUF6800 family protein [Candidatus Omnitrophota bacterium]|jgi:hypothetical protein